MSPTSGLQNTALTFLFTISPAGNYYATPYVTVELDQGFRGAPKCSCKPY